MSVRTTVSKSELCPGCGHSVQGHYATGNCCKSCITRRHNTGTMEEIEAAHAADWASRCRLSRSGVAQLILSLEAE